MWQRTKEQDYDWNSLDSRIRRKKNGGYWAVIDKRTIDMYVDVEECSGWIVLCAAYLI